MIDHSAKLVSFGRDCRVGGPSLTGSEDETLTFCLEDAIDLAPRERLKLFEHAVSTVFVQDWEISSPGLAPQAMWIAADSAEGLAITRGFALPMTATCARPQSSGKRTYYALTSNRPFRVVFPDRETLFGPDEVVILSNEQPCSVICTAAHVGSAFIVDGDIFEQYISDPGKVVGRRLSRGAEASNILRNVMALAWACSEEKILDRAAPRLVRSFLDQISLTEMLYRNAGSDGPDEAARKRRATSLAWRNRVKVFIDANFHRQDLSVAMIARELNISPRYLQLSFADSGETTSSYLRATRVIAAANMLRAADQRHLNITEIAYNCGFNSSSYFSTEFRSVFKMSPREFRHADHMLSEGAAMRQTPE